MDKYDEMANSIAEAWGDPSLDMNVMSESISSFIRRAVAEEREECAKIAEALYEKTYWDDPSSGIAAKIRSRVEEKE